MRDSNPHFPTLEEDFVPLQSSYLLMSNLVVSGVVAVVLNYVMVGYGIAESL